jgi:hypothetical protein
MSFRRYEILLPKRYNDGTAVELEKFLQTNNDLARQFGAVSFLPETLRGIWVHGGRRFEEDNVRLFVDVEDTAENAAFFHRFKAMLKERFCQIDIWIVSYEIRID